jgi:heme/copper-type cytochrome/quinol oxidase subunit 2
MSNINNEFQDNKSAADRLKGTKHFEKRRMIKWFWILLAVIIFALIFSFSYAHDIATSSQTRQQRLDQYIKQVQVANGIPSYQITFKYHE